MNVGQLLRGEFGLKETAWLVPDPTGGHKEVRGAFNPIGITEVGRYGDVNGRSGYAYNPAGSHGVTFRNWATEVLPRWRPDVELDEWASRDLSYVVDSTLSILRAAAEAGIFPRDLTAESTFEMLRVNGFPVVRNGIDQIVRPSVPAGVDGAGLSPVPQRVRELDALLEQTVARIGGLGLPTAVGAALAACRVTGLLDLVLTNAVLLRRRILGLQ